MKYAIQCIGANIVSILCVICAIVMAVYRLPGWGWFLFGALCCFVMVQDKK